MALGRGGACKSWTCQQCEGKKLETVSVVYSDRNEGLTYMIGVHIASVSRLVEMTDWQGEAKGVRRVRVMRIPYKN